MAQDRLTKDALTAALKERPNWKLSGNAIEQQFVLRNFSESFAFMTRVAMVAEKLNHHPEWSNVYKTVNIRLSTHDAGGLTELDFTLARHIDRIFGDFRPLAEG